MVSKMICHYNGCASMHSYISVWLKRRVGGVLFYTHKNAKHTMNCGTRWNFDNMEDKIVEWRRWTLKPREKLIAHTFYMAASMILSMALVRIINDHWLSPILTHTDRPTECRQNWARRSNRIIKIRNILSVCTVTPFEYCGHVWLVWLH